MSLPYQALVPKQVALNRPSDKLLADKPPVYKKTARELNFENAKMNAKKIHSNVGSLERVFRPVSRLG